MAFILRSLLTILASVFSGCLNSWYVSNNIAVLLYLDQTTVLFSNLFWHFFKEKNKFLYLSIWKAFILLHFPKVAFHLLHTAHCRT